MNMGKDIKTICCISVAILVLFLGVGGGATTVPIQKREAAGASASGSGAVRQYIDDRRPTATESPATSSLGETVDPESVRGTAGAEAPLSQARRLYGQGDYSGAASLFEILLRQQPVDPSLHEQALRGAADCYYHIGKAGSNPHLLSAVEYYRFILKNFPDPRPGNESVYINIASAYELLHFYHEAAAHRRTLLERYPGSPMYGEVLFRLAEDLNIIGRFGQAADRYREYLERFSTGPFIKEAHLGLVSVYGNLKDYEKASRVIGSFLDRWPDVAAVPKDILYLMGMTAYHVKRYTEAVRFLSCYVSLYARDEGVRTAFYTMGCAFRDMGRVKTAAQMFSHVIDVSPNSIEALYSILAVADLGRRSTDVRIPVYLSGYPFFFDPLGAYENLLSIPGLVKDLEEASLYAKADIFLRQGRHLDAIELYKLLQRRFPGGKYAAASLQQMKNAAIMAVDENYRKKDYLTAAAVFYRTLSPPVLGPGEAETLMKVADSLRRMFLHTESRLIYEQIKRTCKDGKILDSINVALNNLQETGKGAVDGPRNGRESFTTLEEYREALPKTSPARQRWLLYEIGRLLMREGKIEEARQTFGRIKEGEADPFWSKVSDYALAETTLLQKYPSWQEKVQTGRGNPPAGR